MLKKYFKNRRVLKLMKEISSFLYSDEMSFDLACQKLRGNNNEIELLLSMHFVGFMEKPPSIKDAKEITKEIEKLESELNKLEIKSYKDLLTKKVEEYWVKKLLELEAAKMLHDEDPESFIGAVYFSRKTLGRALHLHEEDKWRELTDNLHKAKEDLHIVQQKSKDFLTGISEKM